MLFQDTKKLAKRVYRNLFGWRTNRKIVIIESDDWGSIRMPSHEVYLKCLQAGYPVDKNPYERYDSIASEEDLTLLFDLLKSFKDKNGNHPVFTSNCVVANPDFIKIKENHFEKYYFELITETFVRYPKHSKNFDLWKQGLAEKIFYPQFHAREHLNVSMFMKALQRGDKDALWGFENQMPGSIKKGTDWIGNNFVEATHYDSEEDKIDKLGIYLDGLKIFEKLFGYRSMSIIPTNYIWSKDYNPILSQNGVRYIQGSNKFLEPVPKKNPVYINRWLGNTNQWGQVDLVRNVFFEPSLSNSEDFVGNCLKEIQIAFMMKKPAIISSHRINYVGFIDEKNRDKSLKGLKKILGEILSHWPDVEFMTSVELGKIIENDSH